MALTIPRHGIEVTIDVTDIEGGIMRTAQLVARTWPTMAVRYHFPLGRFELSSPDPSAADAALAAMGRAARAVAEAGADYLTVHAGLPSDARGTRRLAETASRLSALVEEAGSLGVTVALENLRWGLTAEPDAFLALADRSGAAVTFDIGHANSSDAAARGIPAERFITACGGRIKGAHVYGRETDRHHAPLGLETISPALDALCDVGCMWWTIELADPMEVKETHVLIERFLHARSDAARGRGRRP